MSLTKSDFKDFPLTLSDEIIKQMNHHFKVLTSAGILPDRTKDIIINLFTIGVASMTMTIEECDELIKEDRENKPKNGM